MSDFKEDAVVESVDLLTDLQENSHTIDILYYMYSKTRLPSIECNKSDFVKDKICNITALSTVLDYAVEKGWVACRLNFDTQKSLYYRLTPHGCNICYLISTLNAYNQVHRIQNRWTQMVRANFAELASIEYSEKTYMKFVNTVSDLVDELGNTFNMNRQLKSALRTRLIDSSDDLKKRPQDETVNEFLYNCLNRFSRQMTDILNESILGDLRAEYEEKMELVRRREMDVRFGFGIRETSDILVDMEQAMVVPLGAYKAEDGDGGATGANEGDYLAHKRVLYNNLYEEKDDYIFVLSNRIDVDGKSFLSVKTEGYRYYCQTFDGIVARETTKDREDNKITTYITASGRQIGEGDLGEYGVKRFEDLPVGYVLEQRGRPAIRTVGGELMRIDDSDGRGKFLGVNVDRMLFTGDYMKKLEVYRQSGRGVI